MCGIAGLVKFSDSLDESELMNILPGIAHRGPDGTGIYVNNNIGLLQTRLSILDLSPRANQPLFNEDKTIVLVCNGEIYNYKQLRRELEGMGHSFFCNSDSEVLIHLYEEYRDRLGEMCKRLKGMFAFAIYDVPNQMLFIGRDRFGIKPLYFINNARGFCFASEIHALRNAQPSVSSNIDFTSLFEYYQYLSIPEPNTIYRDIKAMPAGTFGIFDLSKKSFRVSEWYDLLDEVFPDRYSNFNTFSADVVDKIEGSVKEHLVSDVPIGSFLSAGIDSTIISHFACKHSAPGFSCFSTGFPIDPEDESAKARNTAGVLGANFYADDKATDFFDDFHEISQFFDQPFGVSSAFSLYRISKMARKRIKVVLTGDGGDEIFAGYGLKHEPFVVPGLVRVVPPLLRSLVGSLSQALGYEAIARQFKLRESDRFLSRNRIFDKVDALQMINPESRNAVDVSRFAGNVNSLFDRAKCLSPLHRILYVDINTFLKSEMLYKVDRMSMANGLEARVPMLDHELVSLAFSAPARFLRVEGIGKIPLRNWVNQQYPGLGFRKKTGFNAPLGRLINDDVPTKKKVADFLKSLSGCDLVYEPSVVDVARKYASGGEVNVSKIMALSGIFGWLQHR
jgi:asparagine synthase (glutamine-hydrolysing)